VIRLFALGPGSYKIDIEYSTDRSHWADLPTQAIFTILPPLWSRGWFQFIIIGVILLISFLFFRNRLSIYQQREINSRLIHDHQQQLLKAELETLERERSRIARDLHDGIGVDISAIKMTISQLLKENPQSNAVEQNFQRIMQDIKSIIFGLSPPGLQRYGLMETLKTYVNKIDAPSKKISLNTFGHPQLNERESINIFRILQELLANSIKHSNGSNIIINVSAFEDMLSIIYEDDGTGFDFKSVKRGLGLNNIESRVQSAQGRLTFESGIFGLTYSIDLPINAKYGQSS
jgi:signal transduction histidine kinase